MKKIISVFLAFVMLFGVTSSMGVTVFAEDNFIDYYDLINQNRVDYYSQPNCGKNKGLISLSMADFDKDGNNEIISFSYEIENTNPIIRANLYRVYSINNSKKVKLLDSMFLYVKGGGNYFTQICSVINSDLSFSVYQFGFSYGGSNENWEFTTYNIVNDSFTKINDFQYNHIRGNYSFKENVSNTVYKGGYADSFDNCDFFQAVKNAGYDLSAHHHMGFTNSKLNSENYFENMRCEELCGNHIFSFYEDNCDEHFGFINSNEQYSNSYYYCTDDCGLLNPYVSDSEFTLGRDNNNFIHSNQISFGGCFYDRNNHSITNDFLKKQILNLALINNDYSLIVEKMNEQWDGSCYGIALSMAEVFNNILNLNKFTTDSKNYFQANITPSTSEFADVVEYYYLSQYVSNYGLKSNYCTTTNFDLSYNKYFKNFKGTVSNSEFYKKLIEELKQNKATLFCYDCSLGGHAIIACNLKQISETEYRVGLYDENTVMPNSKYGNIKYFNICIKNGKYKADLSNVLPKGLHKICFISSSKTREINPYVCDFTDGLIRNTVKFYVKEGSKFKIVNDKGQYFKFDGKEFFGNLNVLNYREIFNDTIDTGKANYIEYELPNNGFYSYECLDNNLSEQELILYNSDKYYSIKGKNIKYVGADFNNGIKLFGENIVFDLKVNTSNKKSLDCIKGKSSENVSFELESEKIMNVVSEKEIDEVSLDKMLPGSIENINTGLKGKKIILKLSDDDESTPTPGGGGSSGGSTGGSTGGGSIGGGGGGAPAPEIPAETPATLEKPDTTPAPTSIKPATVKVTGTKAKTKALAVYWNKLTGVDGYQIQVATDKNFKKNKKTVTVAKQNASKKTVKKLKKNKKYYVRVRSYKIVNGKKVYGKWSKVKSVKTK